MSSGDTNKSFASVRESLLRLRSTVRSYFGGMRPADEEGLTAAEADINQRTISSASDYTELHRGSVPCPSCKGTGLIPKELESTLVALIPVNDERLKPKRTWLIVCFWVTLCVLIGAFLLFMLMPRTVTLSSDRMPVEVVKVTAEKNTTPAYIDFNFLNRINVTSGNYIPVDLVNLTVNIISKFQPWSSDVVGTGRNATFTDSSPYVLYRTTREIAFNNSVELTGYTAEYCQAPFSRLTSLYISLQFDVTATLRYYYGHQEQVTLSMQQQVCCVPSGNCTSGWVDL